MTQKLLLASPLICACTAPVVADSHNFADANTLLSLSLAQILELSVSVATDSEVPLNKAPSSATVITAADIQAMGARSVYEILERVPGVHVAPSQTSRLDPIVSIRGIQTGVNAQVLFLVNGVRYSGLANGSKPLYFDIEPNLIRRIEVIRGPGSAVYGADAFAGVINIITKTADDIEGFNVGGRAGNFENRDFWAQVGTTANGWHASLSLAYSHSGTDEDRIIDQDLQTLFDGAGPGVSLAPGPIVDDRESIELFANVHNKNWNANFWTLHGTNSVGVGAAQALDPEGDDNGEVYGGDLTYDTADLQDDWNFRVKTSYYYYKSSAQLNLLPAGTQVPIGADGNLDLTNPVGVTRFTEGLIGNPGGTRENISIEAVGFYTGWSGHRMRYAIGFEDQSLETSEAKNFGPGVLDGTQDEVGGTLTDVTGSEFIFLDDTSRELFFASLQDEWQISEGVSLVAGVRYDEYSDFGSTTNPRLALVWENTHSSTIKLQYGSAFRAPSFAELGFRNNPVTLGNPDLAPEEIDTLEVSYSYHFHSDLQTSFNLFAYEAEGLIDYVSDEGQSTQTSQNARDQEAYGFEWGFDWQASEALLVHADFSWVDAEDSDTGEAISDIPGQQFTVAANWHITEQWFSYLSGNWVGDRERAEADLRSELDDYLVFDAMLRRSNIVEGFDASFVIRNALDEDYREPSNGTIANDFPMPGRSFWIELSYKL